MDNHEIERCLNGDSKLSFEVQKDINRLKNGEPLAYVIGFVNFLGYHIDLRYKPLIPRPETEYWVEDVIESLESPNRVLDLCCGSGCIGISFLNHFPKSHITFADIDEDCTKQTSLNCELNGIDSSRFGIIKGDLFENIKGKFDLIVSNPPYVGKRDEIGKEIFNEPSHALFAGHDGMDIISRLIKDSPMYLENPGTLVFEHGENQKELIEKELEKSKFFENAKIQFKKDQFGKDRWVIIL